MGMGAALVLLGSLWLPWFTTNGDNPNSALVCGDNPPRDCAVHPGESANAWQVFSTLDLLLVGACLAPFILTWIIARGHKLTWKPGEVTMIVGISAMGLILCNGIILGKPEPRHRGGPRHRLVRRPAGVARPAGGGLPAPGHLRDRSQTAGRHIASGAMDSGAEARPQPRDGAGAYDRVRRARLRPLDRARRQGGGRRRRGGRHAAAARHGLDGRRGRDRRGGEGRGADALQRRAHRRRLAARRWTSRSTRSRAPSCARRACRTPSPRSRCRSAARCSTRAPASTC